MQCVERSAEGQHSKCLIVSRTQPFWLIKPVLPETLQLLTYRGSQLIWSNRINQCLRQRSPHNHTMFSYDVSLNDPVDPMPSYLERPIGANRWMGSILRIIVPKCFPWNVGTFEPGCIRKVTRSNIRMHVSKTSESFFSYILCGHN